MLRTAALVFAVLAAGAGYAAMSPAPFAELNRMMRAFQESRLLLSAVELDVFTAVGEGATAEEVAVKIKTHPRATGTFLNALVAVGALTRHGAQYRNTPDTARYLTAGSPGSLRQPLMHTVRTWEGWHRLTDSIRQGGAAATPGVEGQNPAWTASFIAAMHQGAGAAARAVVEAVGAAGVRRMLDIGGGSGAYSIAFAEANPELRAEVLDLAPVVEIARRHIREARLEQRVTARVGDLTRDDFGGGYDLALLSSICHMLDEEQNRGLLRRVHQALAPGGRVVIRDFILDPDKTSPRGAALFAVHMLVQTRGGSTYTEQEYGGWLREAGFTRIARPDPAGDLIIGTR